MQSTVGQKSDKINKIIMWLFLSPHHGILIITWIYWSIRGYQTKIDQFSQLQSILHTYPLIKMLNKWKSCPCAQLSTTLWGRAEDWRYSSTINGLGTRRRWMVNIAPRPLNPQGKSPCIHSIRGWVSPRAGLDAFDMRNICCPYRGSTPGRPSIAHCYIDWDTPASLLNSKM